MIIPEYHNPRPSADPDTWPAWAQLLLALTLFAITAAIFYACTL
jgi:hypothetical protein